MISELKGRVMFKRWVIMVVCCWASIAGAQSADTLAATRLADQYVASARTILQNGSAPRPDQLVRARILTDLALELDPEHPEALRTRLTVAEQEQDDEQAILIRRHLATLDRDDHALLRDVLIDRVNEGQTTQDRLATVAQLLRSDASEQLPSPVRAELAAYAAQLADEAGAMDAVRQWVTLALQNDPINLAAAELQFRLLTDSGAEPLPIARSLVTLVAADPVRPAPRVALALALLEQAAYTEATQQFNMAVLLNGRPLEVSLLMSVTVAGLGSGDVDRALELLDQAETGLSRQEPPLELPIDMQLVRLAAVYEQDSEASVQWFERLAASLATRAQEGDTDVWLDLAWITAVFGPEPELAEVFLSQAELVTPDDEALATRARAWAALRLGQTEQAQPLLQAIGADDRWGLVGLALLQPEDRVGPFLEAIIHQAPQSLPSLVAMAELRRRDLGLPSPSADGRALLQSLDRMPRRLRSGDPRALPWSNITLHVDTPRTSYLEPIRVHLKVRNMTTSPMGVGNGRAIPGVALLEVNANLNGRRLPPGLIRPVVVDLTRRLTLDGGESYEVPVRLDMGSFGQLLAGAPASTITFEITMTADPQLDADRLRETGQFRFNPGVIGDEAIVRNQLRTGRGVNPESLAEAFETIENGTDPAERQIAIARMLMYEGDTVNALPLNDADRLRRHVNENFASWPTTRQAWAVYYIPPGEPINEDYRAAIQVGQRSDDTMVRVTYMLAHLGQAEEELFNDALRHSDEVIREFAQAMVEGNRVLAEQMEEAAAQAAQQAPQPAP